MSNQLVLLHSDILIDRRALADALPGAWAIVLDKQHGGTQRLWRDAYNNVAADWESYWADLDLNGDESLAQWREGRWRVVRAWFRLMGCEIPDSDMLAYYLDGLCEVAGAQCAAWRPGAVQALDQLAQMEIPVAIVDPYSPAAIIRGMLVECRIIAERPVIGPDELGQVGLDGIHWSFLTSLVGSGALTTRFVSPHLMADAAILPPPDHLDDLVALLTQGAAAAG